MSEYALTAKRPFSDRIARFYDRIAKVHNLTFKVNGYGRALDQYFEAHPLPLAAGARVLDAGCGTGLLTLAILRSQRVPLDVTAIDLSGSSIVTAKRNVADSSRRRAAVNFAQSDILSLPFADHSFDAVITSGVLEYVPLEEGLCELARVLAPGGHLLQLPLRPSPVTRFLEVVFQFKIHPPWAISETTENYFRVVNHYRFPRLQAIGWTKTAILAQKF
jgi:ubiquinone/menaquinone biosynthesis C-methylase UbiE